MGAQPGFVSNKVDCEQKEWTSRLRTLKENRTPEALFPSETASNVGSLFA
jgi:hypothetical protein